MFLDIMNLQFLRSTLNLQTFKLTPSEDMAVLDSSLLRLPPTADFHVHLRQDEMMELVVPSIRHGGVDTVFVCIVIVIKGQWTR